MRSTLRASEGSSNNSVKQQDLFQVQTIQKTYKDSDLRLFHDQSTKHGEILPHTNPELS